MPEWLAWVAAAVGGGVASPEAAGLALRRRIPRLSSPLALFSRRASRVFFLRRRAEAGRHRLQGLQMDAEYNPLERYTIMKLISGALAAISLLAGVTASQHAAAQCYLGPFGYQCYGAYPYYPGYGVYYGRGYYRHGYYRNGYYRGYGRGYYRGYRRGYYRGHHH